jgi:plasmid stabilization system protein ParE
MSGRIVEFHRLAIQDIRRAVQWYADRSAFAARGLLAELRETIELIGKSPEQHPIEIRNVRWRRLRKFNYVVYFIILDEVRCEIVAVSHGRRRPRYWMRRISRP